MFLAQRRWPFQYGFSTAFFYFFVFLTHDIYFPASGQAVATGAVPSPPLRLLSSVFIAHRVRQSHCSSIFYRVLLLTHALALSVSQFVHKNNCHRIYTSMHSAGLELTKLTDTRLEDNLIRHRGDRSVIHRIETGESLARVTPSHCRKCTENNNITPL